MEAHQAHAHHAALQPNAVDRRAATAAAQQPLHHRPRAAAPSARLPRLSHRHLHAPLAARAGHYYPLGALRAPEPHPPGRHLRRDFGRGAIL